MLLRLSVHFDAIPSYEYAVPPVFVLYAVVGSALAIANLLAAAQLGRTSPAVLALIWLAAPAAYLCHPLWQFLPFQWQPEAVLFGLVSLVMMRSLGDGSKWAAVPLLLLAVVAPTILDPMVVSDRPVWRPIVPFLWLVSLGFVALTCAASVGWMLWASGIQSGPDSKPA